MTDDELQQHLEYVDGIQKAQQLALRVLLRQQPEAIETLRNYMGHATENGLHAELSQTQRDAMEAHLLSLCQ